MAVLSADVLNGIRSAEVQDYSPIPEGDYTVKVNDTELKSTKSGKGQYIKVEFTVLGPKHQGRKLFENFNIINDNPETARIAKQQIKNLMLASGWSPEQVNQFNDTDQLLGLTCCARVSVRDDGGEYGPQNRIKRFSKMEIPQASGGSFSAVFATPQAAPAADAPFSFK